jgi:hypothetical protein
VTCSRSWNLEWLHIERDIFEYWIELSVFHIIKELLLCTNLLNNESLIPKVNLSQNS